SENDKKKKIIFLLSYEYLPLYDGIKNIYPDGITYILKDYLSRDHTFAIFYIVDFRNGKIIQSHIPVQRHKQKTGEDRR
ncbi:MAG: hypothetical protein ABRQ39_19755, partial [Candidatus Eremiobacterota bacterium]